MGSDAGASSSLVALEVGAPARPASLARVFAATVVCAMLNNLSYCIISGAAQDLARHFKRDNDSTVISTVMNVSAILATMLTSTCLIRYRYRARILLVLTLTFAAYAGIAVFTLATHDSGFFVCCVCACFGGLAQVFGETTNLGFLRNFPPEMVGAWGAGTGVAGIVGPLLYLAMRTRMASAAVFFCGTPIPVVYGACWLYLHREATRGLSGAQLRRALGGFSAAEAEPRKPSEAPPAVAGPFAEERAAIRASGGIMFNLVAVYCLEYFIYPGLADRETYCAPSTWYTVMWACYNVGVTISRSSVVLFRIQRVWVLTALQLLNVIGWTLEVFGGGIRNSDGGYAVMAVWMVIVGLFGGASYANCMCRFNEDPDVPDRYRELGINLGFFMSNIGITLATSSFSILNRTVFSPAVLYPSGCAGAVAGIAVA